MSEVIILLLVDHSFEDEASKDWTFNIKKDVLLYGSIVAKVENCDVRAPNDSI
jgi:hypothetical protein